MTGFAALIASITILSLVVTKTIDFIRNSIDKEGTKPKSWWNIAAVVIGLAYCLGWQIDITSSMAQLVPALASQSDRLMGVPGQVLSGLIIGSLSGPFHQILENLSKRTAHHH